MRAVGPPSRARRRTCSSYQSKSHCLQRWRRHLLQIMNSVFSGDPSRPYRGTINDRFRQRKNCRGPVSESKSFPIWNAGGEIHRRSQWLDRQYLRSCRWFPDTDLQKRRPIKFNAPESHEIRGKMQISIAFFEYVPTRYNIARQSADQLYRGAIV